MSNIRSLKTSDLQGPDGPVTTVMIGVDTDASDSPRQLAEAVADSYKVQRMISPPNTSMLLVTFIGPADLVQVSAARQALLDADPVLAAFMSMNQQAVCVHGTPGGAILSEISLLSTA
jgi:hypothetical protein